VTALAQATIDHHTSLEEALFRALNADGGRLLDALAVTLSARWFGVLTGVAVVVAIVAVTGSRRRVGLLVSFAVALVMSDLVGAQVLRPLFGRMRPCFALPDGTVRWLAAASDVGSLPSLHAANFFAMAFVAWAADRRVGVAALALAAAVALSRVYVGVHWPTDVLAGAAWGALCAFTALAVARRWGVSSPGAGGGRPAP
jgi:membrane-associated phospholipid phosphatase